MPPTPQSPPTTSRQRLPYHPHSTYSTRALTTGDVSHAHPLRHTQPRTLFISLSHCLSTSRPHRMEASLTPYTPNSMLQTRASASETNGKHSLLLLLLVSLLLPCSSHSVSLTSLVLLVISLLVFYSLVFFTDVHTGIVPCSLSNWRQSIPSVVAGYGMG